MYLVPKGELFQSCRVITIRRLLCMPGARYNDEGLSILSGSSLADLTDVVIYAALTESVRWSNLPDMRSNMLSWTKTQMGHYVTSPVTKTNQPWYLCVTCKEIKKGDTVQVHYGPTSGTHMAQYAQEKFV